MNILKEKIVKRVLGNGSVKLRVTVYDAAKEAIESNWESLMFAHNEESFISVEVGNYILNMVTNGEVNVLYNGKEFTNVDYEFLKSKVVSKEIYSDEFNIDSSNYFAIMHGSKVGSNQYESICEEFLDSIELENIKSVDEIIDFMVKVTMNTIVQVEDKNLLDVCSFGMIGEILEDGEIEKGLTNQGMVYWNEEAFLKKEGVAYIPELHDIEYTFDEFLRIANNNEDVAHELFYTVNWQSPETLYEEWLTNDELNECVGCKKTYHSYEVEKCPYCGHDKE